MTNVSGNPNLENASSSAQIEKLAFEGFIWKNSGHFKYESTKIKKEIPFLDSAKSAWRRVYGFFASGHAFMRACRGIFAVSKHAEQFFARCSISA